MNPEGMDRREFMKFLGAAGAATAWPCTAAGAHGDSIAEAHRRGSGTWKNWAENQIAHPARKSLADSVEKLVALIEQDNLPIRVVGAGHSFSPLVVTDGHIISLDPLKGLSEVDKENSEVSVWAGTRLYELNELLHSQGMALHNLGDIDKQGIAGAISTGTHGTGLELPCLSARVTALDMMTARGEVITFSESKNVELLRAAQVSLGALGIILRVRMKVRPAFRLQETSSKVEVGAKFDFNEIDRWGRQHERVALYAFPWSNKIIKQVFEETNQAERPGCGTISCSGGFDAARKAARVVPPLKKVLQRTVTKFAPKVDRIDFSHKVLVAKPFSQFKEMEYEVPMEAGPKCVEETLQTFKKSGISDFFPIEIRFVKGDECWLSPFYRRDSISVSIHQFRTQEHAALFQLLERVFLKYGGRPHWGKLHTLGRTNLETMYPRWKDFLEIRRAMDPAGRFLNSHLRSCFGITA